MPNSSPSMRSSSEIYRGKDGGRQRKVGLAVDRCGIIFGVMIWSFFIGSVLFTVDAITKLA
jgi:hypothetical protein